MAADRPKILIVDDKPENLLALERLLKKLPVELHRAGSGNEALRLTLHHDFALALLDIQMPEMDGYELAELLRSEEKTARLPFIFISAIYTEHLSIFRGYELGAFSYITKPFEPEILLSKVRFFIEKYEQEQALKQTHMLLEKRVQERTRELQRSNSELEQFAYVASHDLQEPLRTITSYLQLLERNCGDNLDEKGRKYIGVAVDGAKRMKNLIEALLSYSRVESKGREFRQVDCRDIVKRVLADLRVVIAETKTTVRCTNLPVINADATQMHMLFQNLISNAIKFRSNNAAPAISINALKKDSLWEFSVQDNGIGISSQYFERVFVIFQRLHTRKEYEGTGIGLAICRKIVERHGGTIRLDSAPGKGTTVLFTIQDGLHTVKDKLP